MMVTKFRYRRSDRQPVPLLERPSLTTETVIKQSAVGTLYKGHARNAVVCTRLAHHTKPRV